MSDFAEWLEEELKQRGWVANEIAIRGGIHSGYLSRILNHKQNAGPEALIQIAKALGYPPEIVFRAAGLLPPKPENVPLLDEWEHIFRQAASDEERQRLLELARFELERIKREQKRK